MSSNGVFKKTVLKNGVRVLTESYSDTRCVELGFWLDRGTRDETAGFEGAAHFIEHLVFKGTESYSALDIAKSVEALGGEINAFTTKEHTCYHTSTLKEDFDISLKVLFEIFFCPKFDEQEFEKERTVVLQEILMAKDEIEDKVFDKFFEKSHEGHALGLPILGTEESIENIELEKVISFYKNLYCPENLIVSAVGAIEHDQVVAAVEKMLGSQGTNKHNSKRTAPAWKPFNEFCHDTNSEQMHVLLGLPAPEYGSSERFCAYLMNTILGGGMTSKMYQRVREDNGWAYTVFGMLNTHTDCGSHLFYAATDKSLYTNVAEAMCDEIKKVYDKGLTQEDLDFYLRQARGQIIIASEDIESRMHSLAVNEMVFGEYKSVDSVIAEIESVTLERMNNYIKKWMSLEQAQVFLYGNADVSKTWLEGVCKK